MKTPIILQALIIIALAFLFGLTGRWLKIKTWPYKSTTREHFEIDANMVKNAETNKTYFGTVDITTKREAAGWPIVETTLQIDTLSSEDGGYFGIPN